jgi:6-phosphofructokinase 1
MSKILKKIAVFTSGGDAPGMNACIRAVVRTALANGIEVMGIIRGLQGMLDNDLVPLTSDSVANIMQRGGTILKSSRCPGFKTAEGRKLAYKNLSKAGIQGLVAIGGNGTFTGMLHFSREHGIPFIGLPGTIDNDLYGTDQTIGFDTAVNTAIQAIDKLRDTAESHDRTFFVEVMGRDAGFLALHAGLACGAEAIFIPEEYKQVDAWLAKVKRTRRKKSFSIIVVCEGESEGSVYQIAYKYKQVFPDIDQRVSVIGHLQRGGSPTASDRNLASLLGAEAVKMLAEGKTGVALGWQKGKISSTPIEKAISGKKKIDPDYLYLMHVLSS